LEVEVTLIALDFDVVVDATPAVYVVEGWTSRVGAAGADGLNKNKFFNDRLIHLVT
jgi:hypothetical protein